MREQKKIKRLSNKPNNQITKLPAIENRGNEGKEFLNN